MTHEQFERMRQAAAELLALGRAGQSVEPGTLDWARETTAAAYVGPPLRVAFRQARILNAMRGAPPQGLMAWEIRQASGMSSRDCGVALCTMVAMQRVAMLKIPGRSRYFADQAALEAGRAQVGVDEQARAELLRNTALLCPRKRPPKKPRPPKPPPEAKMVKAPVRPRAVRNTRAREARTERGAPREQNVYVASMLPAGVSIQHVPYSVDTRWRDAHPPVESFMSDWNTRAGQSRSRSRNGKGGSGGKGHKRK